jgi:hypothetical protein
MPVARDDVIVVIDKEATKRERRRKRRRTLLRLCLLAYVVTVAVSCFAFQFWGCMCEATRTCEEHFIVSRLIGVGWCCAAGAGVAAHLYITLPVTLWIWRAYSWRLAAILLCQGAAVGSGLTLLLALGVKGMDPPPGFGLDGVPTGAALFAGLAAWLLFSVSSLIGFRGNHVLGRTTTLACTYLVAVVWLVRPPPRRRHRLLRRPSL